MSSRLYKTAQWRKRRIAQLSREPLCRYCAQLGKVEQATVADHVQPHNDDPHSFFYGELQSLCKQCHDGAKQELERTGNLRGCDADGFPLDPNHHWRG